MRKRAAQMRKPLTRSVVEDPSVGLRVANQFIKELAWRNLTIKVSGAVRSAKIFKNHIARAFTICFNFGDQQKTKYKLETGRRYILVFGRLYLFEDGRCDILDLGHYFDGDVRWRSSIKSWQTPCRTCIDYKNKVILLFVAEISSRTASRG